MTQIENILKEQIKGHKTPSIQYYFFDENSVLEDYRFGKAKILENQFISEMSTYNVFSISKTFTAIAVLQLAEQDKINIDHPVKQYLKDFPYPEDISIRHLLAHSGGIPNPIPLSWVHLANEHYTFDQRAFFDILFRKHKKVKCKPNEKFSYSNLGYVLLGQLIEQVSNTSYERYVLKNIIQRLGLKESDMSFEIQDAGVHAKGYQKVFSFTNLILGFFFDKPRLMEKAEGKWKPFKTMYVNGPSYGGLIGTPHAFVKYVQELLKPNNRLLSKEYLRMMFAENPTSTKKDSGMSLSWFIGELKGNKYYTHAGGGGGYYCEIRIYPDNGVGSVIFYNRTGMSDERFLDMVDVFQF